MAGVNKVILVGYLGRDPEVRYLEAGVAVAKFTLATSEIFTTKDGRKIEQTEWHHVVMWRGLADIAAKYLQKGKLIYLEGKLRTRSFDDKSGYTKTITEVVADNFTMLGRKDDIGRDIAHLNEQSKQEEPMNYDEAPDDELPF